MEVSWRLVEEVAMRRDKSTNVVTRSRPGTWDLVSCYVQSSVGSDTEYGQHVSQDNGHAINQIHLSRTIKSKVDVDKMYALS